MIAWSETKLKVRAVQPRRVACTHCRNPFVYLATDEFEKTVKGLPYISLVAGEFGRRRRLLEAVQQELETLSLSAKGQATCPHCRYQLPWMEETRPATVVSAIIFGFIAGAVLCWPLRR